MSRPLKPAVAVVTCLLLAACSSAPVHYYTLVPPATSTTVTPATPDYAVAVLPVSVPVQVDQPQVVVRTGNGQMTILDGQRWVAPLSDQLTEIIARQLTHRLGVRNVYDFPTPDEPVYRIKVAVNRFEAMLGSYAAIDATWSVRRTTGKADPLTCSSTLRTPIGADYTAMVEGYQSMAARMATRIADTVSALHASPDARCPRS